MKINFRFALGARVALPHQKALQGVITSCGADVADGNSYRVEYVRANGRRGHVDCWEDELVAANRKSKAKRKVARKTTRSARRKAR